LCIKNPAKVIGFLANIVYLIYLVFWIV